MAKIMLVEDDNNLREIYQARLAAEGYELVSAKDGEEALAIAVKEKPDLIVCDVMMPKVSGFEMLDILRSTAGIKDTKVIMMTALSQAEDRVRAEKLGADKYLVKSQVTLEDMAKTVKEVLDGGEPQDNSSNEEALLSRAADTLNGGSDSGGSDSSDDKTKDDDDDDNVTVNRKNIIQPLNNPEKSKSNLDMLLAKEQAKEDIKEEADGPKAVVADTTDDKEEDKPKDNPPEDSSDSNDKVISPDESNNDPS